MRCVGSIRRQAVHVPYSSHRGSRSARVVPPVAASHALEWSQRTLSIPRPVAHESVPPSAGLHHQHPADRNNTRSYQVGTGRESHPEDPLPVRDSHEERVVAAPPDHYCHVNIPPETGPMTKGERAVARHAVGRVPSFRGLRGRALQRAGLQRRLVGSCEEGADSPEDLSVHQEALVCRTADLFVPHPG